MQCTDSHWGPVNISVAPDVADHVDFAICFAPSNFMCFGCGFDIIG